MPWRNYWYRRRRRNWIRYRRPRATFHRRRWRRRRQPVRRKKLKTLLLREFQPRCIRKCKIKGEIPLFWGPIERFNHNYELYELSIAPEKIPSGGLFCIKNFSLDALFAEHEYVRNIWTKTNTDLPMVRYTGCKIKFYPSLHTDIVATYGTQLPMAATLDMYQSMHPGIHTMLQHKIIIPRKKDNFFKPKIKTIKCKPPAPLQNKWYFQHDIATTPLLQIRASALSLDEYYINHKSISTTSTIYFLNIGCIQNCNFKNVPTTGYWARKHNETPIFLWATTDNSQPTTTTSIQKLIFLGNTNDFQEGKPVQKGTSDNPMKNYPKSSWGNPFHPVYTQNKKKVFFSSMAVTTAVTNDNPPSQYSFTETNIMDATRYNPFRDRGDKNVIWLQSVKETTETWKPPQSEIFTSSGLPAWVLTFGFEDFQKKNHRVQNVDTDYMIVLQSNYESPAIQKTYPLIDYNFIQGFSPYENQLNPADRTRWYPSVQMQQQSLNTIAISGPGSPKQPPLEAIQAKIHYCFYFKWGGNLPQMSTITDPKNQPEIHIPTNIRKTNSLQNPTDFPQSLLYSFDERRGMLTDKAIKRIQKDWTTKEISFTDGSRLQAPIHIQDQTSTSEESTSEEEEETEKLLLKLKRQRHKQKLLKHRIMTKLGILQK